MRDEASSPECMGQIRAFWRAITSFPIRSGRLADRGAVFGSTDGYLQCLLRVKSRRERDQLAMSGAALVADINFTASDFCYKSVAEVRVPATDMVDLWLMSKKRDSEMRGKKMRRFLASALLASTMVAGPAYAALKPGDKAPAFKARASLGGKEFTFSLAEALKKGPVVLYFYPAAFTSGCTIEAHEFAEAMGKFQALDATVIGVSNDDIATLNKFSTSECRSKFPVAADGDQRIMKAYDAVMMGFLSYANRTSYVIAPDGHIIYEYTALDPSNHVENTLAAVRSWKSEQK